MKIPNIQITGTIYTNKDKLTDKQKFCEYYRCSIHETDKVARYQHMFPSMPSSLDIPLENYSEEPVYSIQITESMLKDLVDRTTKMLDEVEVRSRDPRVMKMYSEYITFLNLVR